MADVETGYVMRVGDQDDYHVESEIDGVVERLGMHGLSEISRDRRYGVSADGYGRNNYISLFWGTHGDEAGSDPIRELTDGEIEIINQYLAGGDRS